MNDLMSARRPPALEGRDAGLAGAAAGDARCSTSRAAPATSPSASCDRRRRARHVTVLDMTEAMLVEGRQRAEAPTWRDRLDWVAGDAMALPFPDAQLRRLHDLASASGTSPASRTRWPRPSACCKPGGRLMVLEFSHDPGCRAADGLRPLLLQRHPGDGPGGGRATATATSTWSNRSAASRTRRPSPAMIRAAGFGQVRYRNLSMGIAALHSGWKL